MILRYPGGKKKIAHMLVGKYIPTCLEFREPFFGSGAVTFALVSAQTNARLWINDRDTGIAALWTTVIQNPESLVKLVIDFSPTLDAYKEFSSSLLQGESLSDAEKGFRKLAIHQMSYSGLGLKAGGPIGGWGQDPDTNPKSYDIGCRWNAGNLVRKIRQSHLILKGRCREDRCTSLDALEVIKAPGEGVVMYLDPPYVGAGQDLYLLGYIEADHKNLADSLKGTPHYWILSYDDHPLVRALYAGFEINEETWAYTITSKKGNRGVELVICQGMHEARHAFADLW